ncbi:MAG: ATP synthase F1 subunit delta [Gemmataceae bacterium]
MTAEPSTKELHQRVDVGAQRIAHVYAESLLEAAKDQARAALQELDALVNEVFRAEPRLEVFLSSAAVGRHVRHQAIEKALKGRVSDVVYNFLQVLNDHERLDLIRLILKAAHDIDDERNRRLRVLLSTAIPLEQEFRDRVANGVRVIFNLEPILIEKVNPALLGGLKVQIGDVVYDATVSTRIETLKNQILARSSHEIQSGRDRLGHQ